MPCMVLIIDTIFVRHARMSDIFFLRFPSLSLHISKIVNWSTTSAHLLIINTRYDRPSQKRPYANVDLSTNTRTVRAATRVLEKKPWPSPEHKDETQHHAIDRKGELISEDMAK